MSTDIVAHVDLHGRHGPRRRATLASGLDPRRNALNAIRLALAVAVIVAHSWPLTGHEDPPGIGGLGLGSSAVAAFFCISGYLITGSRLRSRSVVRYLWRRVVRIYPAYVAVLGVVAFGIAPLAADRHPAGSWSAADAAGYLVRNLDFRNRQMDIPGTLDHVPYPRVWNGSLWTLLFEVGCYVGIGLVVTALPRRWLPGAVGAALVTAAVGVVAVTTLDAPVPGLVLTSMQLGGYFLAGALLFLVGHRVPLSAAVASIALVLAAATVVTGTTASLLGLPLAYLLLYCGARVPPPRRGARHDISYGLYLYGFPVQQGLVSLIADDGIPLVAFIPLSVATTIPVAWASWLLVERPALRLGGWTPGQRAGTEKAPTPQGEGRTLPDLDSNQEPAG